MNDDFKDLEEREYKVKKKDLLIILVSSLLITFLYQFHLKGYFFEAIMPFVIILITYLIIFRNDKKNKKAYYMLIPTTLIMISDLVMGIDASNKDLNFLILPFLLSIFIFQLLNKNYKLEGKGMLWIFKLFPIGIFSNLRFLKIKNEEKNHKNITNILVGIGFGLIFAIVIGYFLSEADDYFNAFLGSILNNFVNFNPNYIFIFVFSFILIFSILINILKNKEEHVEKFKMHSFEKTIIITFLSVINSVFVLFLISEISRLTVNFLQLPMEYTYSSYAREGFFQLLFVTMINFSVILFLLYKTNLVKENKVIRILVALLTFFSIILIFNSYYRMYLYINRFGFTILRMQVILFLLMELILFILIILRTFNHFKKNNTIIYFAIVIGFYILNLYFCNDTVMALLNSL